MSIATVITRGYGSFGSVALVVTRGYSIPPGGFACIPAAMVYIPGAQAMQRYRPGPQAAQVFTPGAQAAERAC